MRERRTYSTERSSRTKALGFSSAHSRAATATSARCSRVVPYSCMWREAARASGANRVAWPVGSLVGEGLGAGDEPAAGGTLRRAVGYEGDLAEAGLYGRGRVEEVRDEGAATHVGRVGVPGPDAEILSEPLYTTSGNISG